MNRQATQPDRRKPPIATLADIARALGGRRHGSYWTARCPAHDDHHPSLSISEGADCAVLVKCHAGCSQDMVLDALRDRGLWRERTAPQAARSIASPAKPKRPSGTDDAERIAKAQRRWAESLNPRGTWAEDYLSSRGLRLPDDPEILLRTLRFHPRCPFPDGWSGPALVAAFTPILADVPDDPFVDPPPVAIHRIRGRGHDNKKMLGPVKGCAVMISPWWHVHETLHVCEGVEDALGIYNEGADDPDDAHRPIWALGSAGAIRAFPVIMRVRKLVIWADNDASGRGLTCAIACAEHWHKAGKDVVVRYRNKPGADYGDR